MTEQKYTITIQPDQISLEGVAGDSLYTLLRVSGLLLPEDPAGERFRLERGSVSPAEHPEAEEAVFTPAQSTEGWLLASERRIAGDAVLTRWSRDAALPEEEQRAQPLSRGLALVFDVGLATIAAGLVDLSDMRIPLLTACPNSQMQVAADLSQRVKWAKGHDQGWEHLRRLLLEDIAILGDKLLFRAGDESSQVNAVCLAGHQQMLGLLAPEGAADGCQVRHYAAAEVGLTALEPDIDIYMLPAAAPDLGPDVVASCLAGDLLRKMEEEKITLLVDLGMSGEVVAAGRGRLIAASVASLPFEGNGIGCGMPAITGAVIRVSIDERVTVKTVRDARPRGMTGAGLLSAVRALAEQGLIDQEGRLLPPDDMPPAVAKHFRVGVNGREFVLSFADRNLDHDISIGQDDVLQLQMAKAAIHAACSAVLHALGAVEEDIDSVLLAESYKAHLDPLDMLALGMTPEVPAEKVTAIGNAAWQGAFLALSDRRDMAQTELIAARLERLDLTTDMVYASEFLRGMEFGE